MDTRAAMMMLKTYHASLTRQQIRTLKGQVLAGDIDGAMRGLDRILGRRKR